MLSACTANLLDRNLNYEAIDRGVVSEPAAIPAENSAANFHFDADGQQFHELQQIEKYTVELN